MRGRAALTAAAALATVGAAPASATVLQWPDGASIVSASAQRGEQGDDNTTYADVSRSGQFVAIQTRARNFFGDDDPDPPHRYRVGGIFRNNRADGSLDLVASGDFRNEDDDSLAVRGAQNPAISADGRFVSFSTAQPLVSGDTNGRVDVYVRDMTLAPTDPAAYDLVSARDGAGAAATYSDTAPGGGTAGTPTFLGAETTRGAAISDDGRFVVFRTLAYSDLPAAGDASTPPYQLWLRDRQARTTTLLTRTMDTGAPAGGALGPAGISGDGSAVIWTGQAAPAQTPFLDGEVKDPSQFYYLYTRLGEGVTRRITGAVDLDDPGCDRSSRLVIGATTTGPCFGPLTGPEQSQSDIGTLLPAISDDGFKLAFLTGAGPRPIDTTGSGLDLWITDMHPGVTRKAGSTELTREANGDRRSSQAIEGVAMNSDGARLVIATGRTSFVLPTLRLVGTVRQQLGVRDLYAIDLTDHTITRVDRDYGGGDLISDVGNAPTVDGSGSVVAFASSSATLFFGDANDRSDAFALGGHPFPAATIKPPPVVETPKPKPVAKPKLTIQVVRLKTGSIELRVRIPFAGTLAATASNTVRKRPHKVAAARVVASKAALYRLRLNPHGADLKAAAKRGGLAASVVLTLTPKRGVFATKLTSKLSARFVRRAVR